VVEVYPHTKLDGNRKNFLWTYGRTHLSSNLLGHRRGDDLIKIRLHSQTSNVREVWKHHFIYIQQVASFMCCR